MITCTDRHRLRPDWCQRFFLLRVCFAGGGIFSQVLKQSLYNFSIDITVSGFFLCKIFHLLWNSMDGESKITAAICHKISLGIEINYNNNIHHDFTVIAYRLWKEGLLLLLIHCKMLLSLSLFFMFLGFNSCLSLGLRLTFVARPYTVDPPNLTHRPRTNDTWSFRKLQKLGEATMECNNYWLWRNWKRI